MIYKLYLHDFDHLDNNSGQDKNFFLTFLERLFSVACCSTFMSNIDNNLSTGFLHTKNEVKLWSSNFKLSMIFSFWLELIILFSISCFSLVYLWPFGGLGGFLKVILIIICLPCQPASILPVCHDLDEVIAPSSCAMFCCFAHD